MGMTMTQKILARHCGLTNVKAGQLINASIDLIMGSDVTTPIAIQAMHQHHLETVTDPDKIVLVMDHFCPNKDINAAENAKLCREFAGKHGIHHFYEGGKMGIEHALLPEKGYIAPGELILGADSHTCTYGALNAFSTGIGSTDMAGAMYSGESWFKVPKAIKINLTGKFRDHVSGKDLILFIIGKIGVDGARYMSLEFCGDAMKYIGIDDRFTICNMAIEAGAKNAIFPYDEITEKYLHGRLHREYQPVEPDVDAEYESCINLDLSTLDPVVAAPHLPSNVRPAREYKDVVINQVIIGCCTNGHISDLREAAGILKGRKVAENVRCIIIPATQKIYLQAMEEGLLKIFVESGATVSMPTCGPCNGGHVGVLASDEKCVSTTNRNFVGRMGAKNSEVYLASPAVAAASALKGTISCPIEEA